MDYSVVFKIAGVGLTVAILHTVLKQSGKEDFAHWTTLTGFALVMLFIVHYLSQLFDEVKQVFFMQ